MSDIFLKGRQMRTAQGMLWYKIESGCVSGYVKAEFVLTGNEAKEKADKVGIRRIV